MAKPANDVSSARTIARWLSLLIAVVVLWPFAGASWRCSIVPAASPFVALCSTIVLRTVNAITLLGLVVGAAMVFLPRRWFCRWVCPMGFCLSGCSRVGRKLGRKTFRSISIGQWLLMSTVAGAMVGFPLVIWLDPLAIFAGVFHLVDPDSVNRWLALPMLVLLGSGIVCPSLWCGSLCPLGGYQELVYSLRNRRKLDEKDAPTRRMLIGTGVGVALGAVVRVKAEPKSPPIRPPGASGELAFRGLCTRCGNCMRSCAENIIEPDLRDNGISSLLTPRLSFRNGYCKEDCVACTTSCPSGALSPLTVETKASKPIGKPKFDMALCRLSEDVECSDCSIACSYNAIRYEFNESTYTLVPLVDDKKCNGCGACVVACPVKPKKAVEIRP